MQSKMITVFCKRCGNEKTIYPYRKNSFKFCSHSCRAKSRITTEITREKLSTCMKNSWKNGSLKSKVSWNKGTKGMMKAWNKGLKNYLSGENHYNWKGGVTPLNRLVRGKADWKIWRIKVFERDDYTCQNCGSRSGKDFDGNIYIEPHHRIAVNKLIKNGFEKYIYDVRNGITLCLNCHKLTFKINFT